MNKITRDIQTCTRIINDTQRELSSLRQTKRNRSKTKQYTKLWPEKRVRALTAKIDACVRTINDTKIRLNDLHSMHDKSMKVINRSTSRSRGSGGGSSGDDHDEDDQDEHQDDKYEDDDSDDSAKTLKQLMHMKNLPPKSTSMSSLLSKCTDNDDKSSPKSAPVKYNRLLRSRSRSRSPNVSLKRLKFSSKSTISQSDDDDDDDDKEQEEKDDDTKHKHLMISTSTEEDEDISRESLRHNILKLLSEKDDDDDDDEKTRLAKKMKQLEYFISMMPHKGRKSPEAIDNTFELPKRFGKVKYEPKLPPPPLSPLFTPFTPPDSIPGPPPLLIAGDSHLTPLILM